MKNQEKLWKTNKIICGDNLEELAKFPKESVDLIYIDPPFFTTLKGGKVSERYLCDMVKRYGRRAKIDKIISPHTLRHTFATEFYRQTKDIETLRMLLGHSYTATTSIYITLANIDVEKAMSIFIPIV